MKMNKAMQLNQEAIGDFTKVGMKAIDKKNGVKIDYEYIPDEYSQQRLDQIYSMLFDEIKELIRFEYPKSTSITH